MPFLSVILPTCNRNESLAQCLQSLQQASSALLNARPKLDLEVIVTDDNLRETAEELIGEKFPWARWLPGPRRGPAANRNSAAMTASGEWLVFVDDDCIPLSTWLTAFVIAGESREYPVLEGKTIPQGRQTRADDDCPSNLTGGKLWSCNFAIKRSVFLELGGFDEKYPFSMEDVDLHYRIRQNEFPIKFVQDAVVEHPWRRKGGISYSRNLAKSLAYFISKHPQSEPIFLKGLGFKKMIRILVFEFPKNVLCYGNKGSLRVLCLDLCFAFLFLRIRMNRRLAALRRLFRERSDDSLQPEITRRERNL